MSAPKRRRVVRASEEDLYRSCAQGGYCPDDIKNKFENTTLADKLLKIFSSIIFLGGLGIGTGRGSGGAGGYRPLQPGSGGGGRVIENIPLRPNIPVDPLPTDTIPGLIEPGSSAIVPLEEVTPDISVTIDPGSSSIPSADAEIIHEFSNPTFDITSTPSHPSIVTGSDDSVAVLDITPSSMPPRRVAMEVTGGASRNVHVVQAIVHADPTNVFVDPQLSGDTVGYESIELQPLSTSEFEIEEAPLTSTPLERGTARISAAARRLYHRFTQQISTRNPNFLGPVSRAVRFEIDNPAYEPDITVEFERDLEDIAAGPDPDFEDVRVLRRPQYSQLPDRTVRVSRFGQRGHMYTRSGTLVGQNVHFYYDISNIESADAIELLPVGDISGEQIIINSDAESSFIDANHVVDVPLPDEALLDEFSEDFSSGHLLIATANDEDEAVLTPSLHFGTVKVYVNPVYNSSVILDNVVNTENVDVHVVSPTAIGPATISSRDVFSDDYYLHPSLIKRRKRKRSIS